MKCKSKSQLTPSGPPSGAKYVDFIVLAVLAVVGSTAIVVFLFNPANIPSVAKANSVRNEGDVPLATTNAGGDENAGQPMQSVAERPTHSLTATAVDGSVSVTPNKAGYNQGEKVTLRAVANTGYSFTGWSGDLSGSSNPAEIVMETDRSVTARFAVQTYSLTATAVGGSVIKSPDKAGYRLGETVTVKAVPNDGYSFTSWSGDLAGSTNPATLSMRANKSVAARFTAQTYSLTASASGGSVIKNPDRSGYSHGATVTLRATPNDGYVFSNWSGDLSGSSNPATLAMDASKSVTANFVLKSGESVAAVPDTSVTRVPPKVPDTSVTRVTPTVTDTSVTRIIPRAGFPLEAQAGDVVPNSIGMKLVYIPGGSFMMGSGDSAAQLAKEYDTDERRFANELPQHQVRISRGFWVGQTEVTQGQYRSVMNAQPWSGKAYVQEDAGNPAVYVSWDEAAEFCTRLSQQEGRIYRLPTEAEWEYACRAGTATRYSFGDSDSSLGDYAWFDRNADKAGQDYAHAVGQKKPNAWGVLDMHGNVFEWCNDYYDEKYYSNSPSIDPVGPPSGVSHVVRGGSWDNTVRDLRCSHRSDYRVSRGLLVGFRVVAGGEGTGDVVVAPVNYQPPATADKVGPRETVPTAVTTPVVDTVPDASKIAVIDTGQGGQGPEPATDKVTTVNTSQGVKSPEPQIDKPAAIDTTQATAGSVTVSADKSVIYTGSAYDILDAAAVGARSGDLEQARSALSSLLKDKDVAVMAWYELGLIPYENGDVDKALPFFTNALASAFPGPASGRDERALTALLDQETDAARIRYELGLICQSQGKQDQAAKLFRNSLNNISAKGATYIGVKKCKSCHFKQWNSWRKTKMAQTFEVLKPGVRSEEKTKLKFDPNKDYTQDATCLDCHTTGFGMPGGYVVPAGGDSDATERAEDNAGVTCEGCHGPGSKSVEIQEDIKENKRPYTFAELRAVGFHRAGVRSCTPCHNASDPGKGPGYHFPYEEKRKEDQHENIELKYRQD